MYSRILKKDLKRKKTMNFVLLVFILLAAMFIASGGSNMVTIFTALDNYFEMAEVPGYWLLFNDITDKEKYEDFASENNYGCKSSEMISANADNFKIDGRKFDYSNIICIETTKEPLRIFDSGDNEITNVSDGEIYFTENVFYSEKNNFKIGSKIQVTINGVVKDFILKDYTKDAICSSSMMGITRILVSENDYNYLKKGNPGVLWSCNVYTDDKDYNAKVSKIDVSSMARADYNTIKLMYITDIVIAATILVTSICIILISMVILRFTINFTMNEEYREIGVMKAIGIKNGSIRFLYIVKYLAISVTGALAGFIASIPFGKLLLKSISKNIIMPVTGSYIINLLLAMVTVFIVVLFCYFCTRNINKISPVIAIRNGETGERYVKKGFIHLSKSRLAPVPFMAANDILSSPKRYMSMVLVFTLGILLVIVPVNTVNTLSSDKFIELLNMASCDHVISQKMLVTENGSGLENVREKISSLKKELKKNNIDAIVFQEICFVSNIFFNGNKAEVMAEQGAGDINDSMYLYIDGTPPENCGEIAISSVVAEKTGAGIGDDAEVQMGGETKKYTVTAIFQSMQNAGATIRLYHGEDIASKNLSGVLGIQVRYKDNPGSSELSGRKKLLESLYPDDKVYSASGYVTSMIGDISGQINSVKNLVFGVVICINMLVTILMVKSFITKEKGEIAILKAIGFKDISLSVWQTLRIVIILLVSAALGILLSSPVSQLLITPIFRMMGAYSIKFDVNAFEVYLFYPFFVLITASSAAFLSSQGLRKIQASQASNID